MLQLRGAVQRLEAQLAALSVFPTIVAQLANDVSNVANEVAELRSQELRRTSQSSSSEDDGDTTAGFLFADPGGTIDPEDLRED